MRNSAHAVLRATTAAQEPEPCGPQPVWLGPPDNVLGEGCAFGTLLARTDDVALGISGLMAFPTGFSFLLSLHRRVPSPRGPGWGDPWHHRPPTSGEPVPEVLRFGIQFSDGRKATTLDGFPDLDPRDPGQLPPGPVLIHRVGSGGGELSFEQGYWVWPLPPPGPLAFVCEWPSEGIELTRAEVEAGVLTAASGRAQVLWDAPTSTGAAGWTTY